MRVEDAIEGVEVAFQCVEGAQRDEEGEKSSDAEPDDGADHDLLLVGSEEGQPGGYTC